MNLQQAIEAILDLIEHEQLNLKQPCHQTDFDYYRLAIDCLEDYIWYKQHPEVETPESLKP